MNLIDLKPLSFLKAEVSTLLDAFEQVQVTGVILEGGRPAGGNLVLFASERSLPKLVRSKAARTEGAFTLGRAEIESFANGAEPLRDDFAPVDQLRTIR